MRIKLFIYTLLLLICTTTAFSADKYYRVSAAAKKGIIDLRSESFKKSVALNGEWIFFWNELLEPGQSPAGKGGIVGFPGKWTTIKKDGKRLPAYGYATYKATVLLPETKEPLRIEMPDVYSAYKLYVNGIEAANNGTVSIDPQHFVPYWQYKFVEVEQGADTLNLVLQIANFSHSKGGIVEPIILGKKSNVLLTKRRSEAIDLLLTGCLFMGGFFFFGLYLLGNRDKAILFFSLFSMFYSYRTIGSGSYVLHTILPDISWYITLRLEYLSLFMGMGLFTLYTFWLFHKDVNKPFLKAVIIICFGFSLLTVLIPPLYFTQLLEFFLWLMIFCLVYLPYVYVRAYKNKRPGAIFSLLSALPLFSVISIGLLSYWGLIPQLQLISFAGYVSFFFLQSLVLSHRVSFVLTKARKQAEQGLKAKSEFLSTMSHEIRTPLNSVIGMSHLLLKSSPRPDQEEQLEVMLFSANNLLAIVNDILDFNKIEAGKISFENIEMDVAAIAGNIVKGLQVSAHDKGIALKLHVDEALKNKVLGDPTRMFQVISNLVHNAIKFTRTGHVEVVIRVKKQNQEAITLLIEVKDTGIGISREQQKLIFERFTQADSSTSRGFGGTGLGLAICKRILELQNSTLHVSSEEGEGSTFYFVQSFNKSIKTAEARDLEKNLPQQADKPLAGIHILLVEDNPMNVMVAQSFLQRWGASIDVAVNGLEAVNMVDADRHRLVLIDLHMPVMDGFEASRTMRKNGITIPIIALTANLPSEIERDIKQAGIDDLVVKPFLPDELYRKVLRYVDSASIIK